MGGTAPSVRAVGAIATGNATSVNVVVPAGAVVGDTLVLAVTASGSAVATLSASGWTLQKGIAAGTSTYCNMAVLTKACVSGDPGKTYAVVSTVTGKRVQFVIALKDVDSSLPIVAVGAGVTDTATSNTHAINTATGTSHRYVPMVIVGERAAGTAGVADLSASTTWTWPAGYTNVGGGVSATTNNSGEVAVAAAIGNDSASGSSSPSGNVVAQYSNARYASVALLIGSATTAAPSLPQVDVLQSGSWIRCNVLGYGQGGVLTPVSVVAGKIAAAAPSAVAPALSADFNSGVIPSWLNVHPGNISIIPAAAYEGANGARLVRDGSGLASLTSSGGSFPSGHTWASFTMRFKLLTLPDLSDSYMNLYEIGNALTAAPKSQHTVYFNAQKLWLDFDASEKIDLGLQPAVGDWHRVEARVYFGGTAYTAIVRLDGGNPITFTSPANKTPTTADVLWIHYPTTAVDYDMDVDLIGLTTADSDPGWLIG